VSDYENVYVIQNSEGEVKKVIAVDWLRVEGEGPFSILDPIKGAQAAEILIGDASITQSDMGLTIQGNSSGVADVSTEQILNFFPALSAHQQLPYQQAWFLSIFSILPLLHFSFLPMQQSLGVKIKLCLVYNKITKEAGNYG